MKWQMTGTSIFMVVASSTTLVILAYMYLTIVSLGQRCAKVILLTLHRYTGSTVATLQARSSTLRSTTTIFTHTAFALTPSS